MNKKQKVTNILECFASIPIRTTIPLLQQLLLSSSPEQLNVLSDAAIQLHLLNAIPKSKWQMLTNPILAGIFDYIEDYCILSVVERVCRTWRLVSRDYGWDNWNATCVLARKARDVPQFWSQLGERTFRARLIALNTTPSFPKPKLTWMAACKSVREFTIADYEISIEHFKQLTQAKDTLLSFYVCDDRDKSKKPEYDVKESYQYLSQLHRLKSLGASLATTDECLIALSTMKALQVLNLDECRLLTGSTFHLLPPSLTDLLLSQTNINDDSLRGLQHLPSLTRLWLQQVDRTTDATLDILSNFACVKNNTLKKLAVEINKISPAFTSLPPKAFDCLTTFNVFILDGSDAYLRMLSTTVGHRITYFELQRGDTINDMTMEMLKSWPRLLTCSLIELPELTDITLTHLQHVHEIFIENCLSISGKALCYCTNNLQYLTLKRMKHITISTIRSCLKQCRALKTLTFHHPMFSDNDKLREWNADVAKIGSKPQVHLRNSA